MKIKLSTPIFALICTVAGGQALASQECNRALYCNLQNDYRSFCFLDPLLIEGKLGFYIPLGQRFRDVYSRVECIGGVEATYHLTDSIGTWLSVSYLADKGRSLNLHSSTSVSLLPIGFGLKYFYQTSCAKCYVGGGFQYTHLHTKDSSPYVIHKVNHWDWGLLAKAGALVPICDKVFLDFFAEYSFLMMSFRKTLNGAVYRHRPNLCSVNFGVGIGYEL